MFKLTQTKFNALQGGFNDKLVKATGNTAEATRKVVIDSNREIHFLSIEVADEQKNKTWIEILVQPNMENIITAVQYRMDKAFYITFDSQYNHWVEKRETTNTNNSNQPVDNENAPF